MAIFISLKNISKTYKLGEIEIPALREVTLDINNSDLRLLA